MVIAETAARKLLHGGGGSAAVARGVATSTLSFGLDSLWQLTAGFFADIFASLFAALAGVVHLLVLPFEALWHQLVAAVAGAASAISFGIGGLWHLVAGFFANLFAALAGAAHELVLPFEALWHLLVAAVAVAAGAISSGLGGLWHLVAGFFAALAGAVHELVLPLEALWHQLVAACAGASGAISFGIGGLWQLVAGFFPHLFAALVAAAHELVPKLEAFWHQLVAGVADATGAISSGLGSLWQLVARFVPHIFAALAGAAHELAPKLEAFWRWLQAAAVIALPYVLGVVAVLLLVALVWCYGPAICAVTVGMCRALVYAVCYLPCGLISIGSAAAGALSCLLPPCAQCLGCCAVVTMRAPGTAGMVISRAAFVAYPALYFLILHAGGAVVATACFCARPVAWAVAAPVAFLFRISAGV